MKLTNVIVGFEPFYLIVIIFSLLILGCTETLVEPDEYYTVQDEVNLRHSSTNNELKILFVSFRDGNAEIYAMKHNGNDQTRLTNNSFYDGFPRWSPDKRKILFGSYRESNWDIYVMNADGSGVTRLTDDPLVEWGASWSPDGNKIIYSKVYDYGGNDENWDLWTMNADGSEQTPLLEDPDFDESIASWSPDGSKIMYLLGTLQYDPYYSNDEIWVMNADGSGKIQLTDNPGFNNIGPRWSPDGSKIVFNSNRDGNFEIYMMNPDGTDETNLTNHPGYDRYAAWSPGGNRIAFSTNRDGNIEIYVMKKDASNLTRVTDIPRADFSPDWASKPNLYDND